MERVVGNAAARVALAARAQSYLSALAKLPDASPALRLESARGFIALAKIQGVPGQPNFGNTEQSRANLQAAIAMMQAKDLNSDDAVPVLVDGLSLRAMIEMHADLALPKAEKTVAAAEKQLDFVPPERRQMAWYAARSQLRRSQLDLAVNAAKPVELQRLATLLEREIAEWPANQRSSRAAQMDRAYAWHYRGLHGYLTEAPDTGVEAFLQADRLFAALDRAQPNDPVLLYTMAYNGYYGSGTALGSNNHQADAPRFLQTALQTLDRLMLIEPNDNSLRGFAAAVRGGQTEALAASGRFREALAAQQKVVALYEQTLVPQRKTATLTRMVIAYNILGNVSLQSKDRTLACASHNRAGQILRELESRGVVAGAVEIYKKPLNVNIRLCARGVPLSQLPLVESKVDY